MEMIRYCPFCGHVGPVPPFPALNCCPDGYHAQMVPWAIALIARLGFDLLLEIRQNRKPSEK
jgi:hypothetical protein